MRVLVASRSDGAGGGAGRVADDLAAGLDGAGHRVLRVVRRVPRSGGRPRPWLLPGPPGDVLLRNAVGIDPSGAALVAFAAVRRPQIVHLHDAVVAFGQRAAAQLARRSPVVVTLHDFSAFTGGCLFAGDCLRYAAGCGGCPQVGHWPLSLPVDRTAQTWLANHAFAKRTNVAFVSPSQFMADLARRGAVGGARIEVIANPVDTSTFVAEGRTRARAALGLTERDRVVLFVAFDASDPRKGFADLAVAFDDLARHVPSARLMVVGRSASVVDPLRKHVDRLILRGPLSDPAELASIYLAADVLAVPSHRDNAPCTIAEALACGTPVVAYRTGGIAEMFVDGQHGTLCDANTPAALSAALRAELLVAEHGARRRAAREHAVERFSLRTFVAAHEALYRDLVSTRG